MGTIQIVGVDTIDTLAATERLGVVKSLTRVAHVVGFTGFVDYQVLWASLNAANIPAIGSGLTGIQFDKLILVERSAKMMNENECQVTLQYEHILEGAFQNLSDPTAQAGMLYGKTKCSITQKPVNFYIDRGYNVGDGFETGKGDEIQVVVSHTFPDGSSAFPDPQRPGKYLERDPDIPGQTVTQGGEVNVQIPQRNFQMEGIVSTSAPWMIANRIIGRINAYAWMNQGETEWMCTEVAWEILKKGRYKFGFEFQHNSDSWDPTAVFIDERSGRPPPNLVAGVGYRQIPYHERLDFNAIFGALFEGWSFIG